MHWLQTEDVALFRFINGKLANPLLDHVMPFVSGNVFFFPVLVLLGFLLICKGRSRGTICLLMLALTLAVGDGFICRTIKHAVGRDRPFITLPDVNLPGPNRSRPQDMAAALQVERKGTAPIPAGQGASGSMPSSHAANWFAATMVALIYYRRSIWFMLPLAFLVSFSRVYNGVHYPSDVFAGAILGAGYAAGIIWLLDGFWQWAGARWFPLWWKAMPSLIQPTRKTDQDKFEEAPAPPRRGGPSAVVPPHATLDAHWLRLGYILIALLLFARLAYISSHTIELGEDEAYQWLWSKHLALSYFSKPPLIACVQFLGTSLWGDTAFGVRFFSPVIAAILSFIALRFFAREVNARAGFFLLLIVTATPLMAVGAVLMTIDPLSVLFWTAAMLAGWRAAGEKGTTRDWLWTGLWMGLGFLSKYTELLQLASWALFFILWTPARKHLRRPGPWLALLVHLVCALPVLIWNQQHHWVTVGHVADDARVGQPWVPTLRYLGEFLASEIGLLNPVFFVGMVWAAIVFWRRGRHHPLLIYFFSMGAPLFLTYLLYTFHSRVLPNWIAPSVLPLFCLMVAWWDTRWRLGSTRIKPWLMTGLSLGFVLVLVGHNTDLIPKLTGHYLPVNKDPLHRVRQWSEVARVAGEARQELLAEAKPVFIIADHYGLVGEISFYLPEARAAVTQNPIVFYKSSVVPRNQFFYWPGYLDRKGENAIYVRELDRDDPKPGPIPEFLTQEFESVTDLGVRNVMYHHQVLRPLRIIACRGLR